MKTKNSDRFIIIFFGILSLASLLSCGGGSKKPVQSVSLNTVDFTVCNYDEDPNVACGLTVIGHDDVLGRDDFFVGGNFNIAWIDNCAYVASGGATSAIANNPVNSADPAGVAVIDVSDPKAPKVVSLLRTPGAIDAVEAIDAVQSAGRKVLVMSTYGGRPPAGHPLENQVAPALDVYDVSGDCTEPVYMSTVYWPDNAHNITLNPSGTRVYGNRFGGNNPLPTVADTVNALGGEALINASPIPLNHLMVMDITDMVNPQLLVQAPLILPDGVTTTCHHIEFNLDESRMYCGSTRVSREVPTDGREPETSSWANAGPIIWDVTEVRDGEAEPVVHFVGQADIKGQGGHHATPPFQIGDKQYMVAANELALPDCDHAAYARIWDVSDETRPFTVGQFMGPAAPDDSGACAGIHYNNVYYFQGEVPIGLFGWNTAGVRIVDLRRPESPQEVAYYKPSDSPTHNCWSLMHYDVLNDNIWFACSTGFYVAKLKPRVVDYLRK